jgi:hypothetical protein
MGSQQSLRQWVAALLPNTNDCCQHAAHTLVRALMVGFHAQLGQLARQTDRSTSARGSRQYLHRWLKRPHWDAIPLYTQLQRLTRRVLERQAEVLLLIDVTDLSHRWRVLQVSTPWQRRALPLFRVVYPYAGPDCDPVSALAQALEWLGKHLPGPRARYVLVMDRGFPSKALITELQQDGWRFVVRVKSNWRLEHSLYAGQLRYAPAAVLVSTGPLLLPAAHLGYGNRGWARRCTAHVVYYVGPEHQEPWFLVTSETDAQAAVAIYRQRMAIEAEFRDLKGPLGLDRLADWHCPLRVARFLAWMAVYEWRLAYLWEVHQLHTFAEHLQIKGTLSWIRTVREWIAWQIRSKAGPAPACL